MESYKLKDTFTITEECANQNIVKMVITEVKNNGFENQYKLTSYSRYELTDGSVKKQQESRWYNAQSIDTMINEFRAIVKK